MRTCSPQTVAFLEHRWWPPLDWVAALLDILGLRPGAASVGDHPYTAIFNDGYSFHPRDIVPTFLEVEIVFARENFVVHYNDKKAFAVSSVPWACLPPGRGQSHDDCL